MNAAGISLTSSALNNWHAILTEAEKTGQIDTLLAVVLAEYGENPQLQAAIAAYRSPLIVAPAKSRAAESLAPTTPTPPTPAPQSIDIFLSYSRADKDPMQRLYADLQAAGFTVWIDDLDLQPGTPSWQRAVEAAIHAARCMVVILSPEAKNSEWVGRELSYAALLQRPIFPVLVSGNEISAVPLSLINHQRVDLRNGWQGVVERLLPSLRRQLGHEPPKLQEPVQQPLTPPLRQAQAPGEGPVMGSSSGSLLSDQASLAQSAANEEPSRPPAKRPATEHRLLPSALPDKPGASWGGGQGEPMPKSAPRSMTLWVNMGVGLVLLLVGYAIYKALNWPAPPAPAGSAPATATPPITAGEWGVAPPINPVTLTTWTDSKYDLTFVYVPAGEFLMGSSDTDNLAESNEKPQRSVFLDAFWIMQTEVTNAQYQKCVDAAVCTAPGNDTWDKPENAEYPVTHVDWQQASAYAKWTGGQLPSEAQWEKAARGPGGLIYPWGNDWQGNWVNFCDKNCTFDWKDENADDGYAQSAPVGTYRAGASPYGAYDMVGNVWEWVADWYAADYYQRAPAQNPPGPASGEYRSLRGGSWGPQRDRVRASYRGSDAPAGRSDHVGFRVVRVSSPGP